MKAGSAKATAGKKAAVAAPAKKTGGALERRLLRGAAELGLYRRQIL